MSTKLKDLLESTKSLDENTVKLFYKLFKKIVLQGYENATFRISIDRKSIDKLNKVKHLFQDLEGASLIEFKVSEGFKSDILKPYVDKDTYIFIDKLGNEGFEISLNVESVNKMIEYAECNKDNQTLFFRINVK